MHLEATRIWKAHWMTQPLIDIDHVVNKKSYDSIDKIFSVIERGTMQI
jgi:hypothetical protein